MAGHRDDGDMEVSDGDDDRTPPLHNDDDDDMLEDEDADDELEEGPSMTDESPGDVPLTIPNLEELIEKMMDNTGAHRADIWDDFNKHCKEDRTKTTYNSHIKEWQLVSMQVVGWWGL